MWVRFFARSQSFEPTIHICGEGDPAVWNDVTQPHSGESRIQHLASKNGMYCHASQPSSRTAEKAAALKRK
jgi:hypothetical protein